MSFTRSYTKPCKGEGRVRVRQDFTMPTKVLALHLVWSERSRGVDIRLTDIHDLEACADVLRKSADAVEDFIRETKKLARPEQEDHDLPDGVEYVGLPAYCYRDVK